MVEIDSSPTKPLIYDLDFHEIEGVIKEWQQPPFRARQIWEGLYKNFWRDPEQFSNLPVSLRKELTNNFRIVSLKPVQVLHSTDGETTKTLFQLPDGKAIEAVLMKYEKTSHVVYFHSSRLCYGLCLLRHRPNGIQTSFDQR